MGSRPTIADLATAAGVSVATVDRVLNGRLRVREETARRVYDAATSIGYHAAPLIHQRVTAALPEARLGFILQKEHQPFYQAFAREISAAASRIPGYRVTASTIFVKNQSPEDYVAALEAMANRCHAVALTSLDHHTVTRAVEGLTQSGKAVFSLLSDFAQGIRNSYIGLNNMKVGRTAAWFLSRTARRPGKVALFVGSHRWHGHQLRETGFRSFFREHAPEFEILDTLVNLETRQVTYEATLALLDRHADISGIYIAGGGMEGAVRALREIDRDRAPTVVVNEITPDSVAALQDAIVTAVIATPLDRLCTILVELMCKAAVEGSNSPPGQVFLPFEIRVPESV